MIIGVYLRYFKTYSGINYIPLTNGHSFCGLVGNNGIGKSSVLESLDSLLNNKDWNYNIVVKKSGVTTVKPHIVPVYLLSPDRVSQENLEIIKKISDYIWSIEENDIAPPNRNHFKPFQDQRRLLKRDNLDNMLLIPLGLSYDKLPSLSIFNTKQLVEILTNDTEKTQLSDQELKNLLPIYEELKNLFEYIYIPKNIDAEDFTQLETKEIQSLMGETLNEIVEKCVPQTKIHEINTSLSEFINSLSNLLGEYSLLRYQVAQ